MKLQDPAPIEPIATPTDSAETVNRLTSQWKSRLETELPKASTKHEAITQ